MKRSIFFSNKVFSCLAVFLFIGAAFSDVSAQPRDYMTEAEIEIVRDAQDIDLRMTVLVMMIDRRLTVLGINSGGEPIKKKDIEKWGEAPTGTQIELFTDIRKLLDKAIDDLDVIASRNEDAVKQNKTEGVLFPKAVRILEAATRRYAPLLKTAAESSQDDRERGQILHSIESCEQIIEAAATLPPPVVNENEKKKKSKID